MKVSDGSQVAIEYTLKLEDDSVVDSNVGQDPLIFVPGNNQVIPGFEQEVQGLSEGDTHEFSLPPEEAYGPVKPDAFVEISKEEIPEEARQVDQILQARDQSGQSFPARVAAVEEEKVVLDLNHPLAGKVLHFAVRVLSVKPGSA